MSDLNTRIKEVIIESLELEDITPADIVDSAPIFGKNAAGEGLGLDSIDALELGIAIKENFGVTFSTVKDETKKHFASVNALADYIARLKSAADPRWIDGSYYVVTDVLPDGSTIGANTNPLLNFASYKLEHYENYRQSHTNFVNETDAHNAFAEEWSNMVRNRQNRERALERAQRYAKHIMRDRFWLFGAKDWPSDVKAACRSNMVSRAHLTADEDRYIFDEVPDWYYKVMGIKRK